MQTLRVQIIVAVSLAAISLYANADVKKDKLPAGCSDATPVVMTNSGKVCGIRKHEQGLTVDAYLGIPYAKAPTDDLRWRAPEPVTPWQSKIFAAIKFGSMCTQPAGNALAGSEDCLYLNVWKPIYPAEKAYPVLVDIHGGGFLVGNGGEPVLNGAYTVTGGNVMMVTLNYRLGSFGFLRYQDHDSKIAGNFAMQDQIAALQWVQDNIAAFGGDPRQVTIVGESAGAISVGLHLFSMPKSNHLFRAAVMESNVMSIPYYNAKQAEAGARKFVDSLCKLDGKNGSACPRDGKWLRSLPTAMVMKAQNKTKPIGGIAGLLSTGITQGVVWAPTVGVAPVVGQPIKGYGAGSSPKPFVVGFNRNEGVFFIPEPDKFTDAAYEKLLIKNFGAKKAKKVLDFAVDGSKPYNPSSYEQDRAAGMTPAAQAMASVITDYAFVSANMLAIENAMKYANNADKPIYGFYFTQKASFNYTGMQRCSLEAGFICHASELPFVFHNFIEATGSKEIDIPDSKVTEDERDVSDTMNASWTAFVRQPLKSKTGWRYDALSAPEGPYVNFNDDMAIVSNMAAIANYPFWKSIGFKGA